MWGLLSSNFGKILKFFFIYEEIFCLLYYSSMKRIKSIVANAKVIIVFFIHLHIFIKRDVENVRIFINRRKTSFLLNRCWNI